MQDGEKKLIIRLFDNFYYHPGIHAVLRHSPDPVVYIAGDALPLKTDQFDYPLDFDLPCGQEVACIRQGVFVGFGSRDEKIPLINTNGIQTEGELPRNFGKYRRVLIWEDSYEI